MRSEKQYGSGSTIVLNLCMLADMTCSNFRDEFSSAVKKKKKKNQFFSPCTREQCYSKKGKERVMSLQLHKSMEQPERVLEGSSICSSRSIVILHASCNSILSHIILEQGCFLNAIFVFRLIKKLETISCCRSCSRSH